MAKDIAYIFGKSKQKGANYPPRLLKFVKNGRKLGDEEESEAAL